MTVDEIKKQFSFYNKNLLEIYGIFNITGLELASHIKIEKYKPKKNCLIVVFEKYDFRLKPKV